jgi:hypothetical protein
LFGLDGGGSDRGRRRFRFSFGSGRHHFFGFFFTGSDRHFFEAGFFATRFEAWTFLQSRWAGTGGRRAHSFVIAFGQREGRDDRRQQESQDEDAGRRPGQSVPVAVGCPG